LRIADREPDTPARHVEGLRERVELDRDVPAAGNLEDARRALAEVDLGISGIVAEDHAVTLGEANGVGEESGRRDGRGGGVRIVEPEELRGAGDVGGDRGRVGEHRVPAAEWQTRRLTAGAARPGL